MSVNDRYRRERPYAAHVIETQEALSKIAQDYPGMNPRDALPATQFAIAFAILDLSDAIRERSKGNV